MVLMVPLLIMATSLVSKINTRVALVKGWVNSFLAFMGQLYGSSNFLVKRWEKLFLLLSSRPSTLGIVQEPLPQERDASTAIHGSFERLQFIDLSLGNALAPRQTQSSMHGVIVLLDPGHEAPQFRNATFGSLLHPGRQIVMFALAHHREKGGKSRHRWSEPPARGSATDRASFALSDQDPSVYARGASVTHVGREPGHVPCVSEQESHRPWWCADGQYKPVLSSQRPDIRVH